jgi:hypothetical protein
MRWVGHVAGMGKGEEYTAFWWGTLTETHHLGDSGIDRRITLRLIIRM